MIPGLRSLIWTQSPDSMGGEVRATTGRMNALAVLHNEYDVDAGRWQSVIDRDRAADGQFVYAVTSTGVFCRPSCPSRRPRRERVRFFESPREAERAGFRSCLRCRPPDPAADLWLAKVARACHEIIRAEE